MQARLNAQRLQAQIPTNPISCLSRDGDQNPSPTTVPHGQEDPAGDVAKRFILSKRALTDSSIALDAIQPVKDETRPQTDAFDGTHDLYYETQRREQAEKREYIRRELAEVLKRSEWLKESKPDS